MQRYNFLLIIVYLCMDFYRNQSSSIKQSLMRTAIIGGGAAGFFLAINLKEMMPEMEVTLFERGVVSSQRWRCREAAGATAPIPLRVLPISRRSIHVVTDCSNACFMSSTSRMLTSGLSDMVYDWSHNPTSVSSLPHKTPIPSLTVLCGKHDG